MGIVSPAGACVGSDVGVCWLSVTVGMFGESAPSGVSSRNATAAPMTYLLNGTQFIAVATGGANLPTELIALSLP